MASGKTGVPVSFDKIQKSFGAVRVLEELNLQIEPGEFLVLLGASGSGKTTALRILSGLETATAGRVLIGDRDVTNILPKYRDISMVFQSYALYPHKTVAENIGFPLKVRKVPQAEQDRQFAMPPRRCSSAIFCTATRASFPAASASASRLPAPSSAAPRSS